MLAEIKILNQYLKEYIEYLKYRHTIPKIQNHDDLYIVEFPKSGITWLGTILTNTCFLEEDISKQATHFNLEQFIGDIHVNNSIKNNESIFPYHRIMKSHNTYNPYYRHVIYLLRNPFSVMNSYFHFAVNNNLFKGDLESFIKSANFGIKTWIAHVDSWINPPKSLKFHIIKYEDLIDKPEKTMSFLYKNLGWDINEFIQKKSIELSSFKNMKSLDEHYKQYCPFRKYDFIREGKKHIEISDIAHDYIYQECKHILKDYYPELLKDMDR